MRASIIGLAIATSVPSLATSQDNADAASRLIAQSEVAFREGRTEDAFRLAKEALPLAEAAFGLTDPLTLRSTYNLAYLLHGRGQAEAAEPLYRRALAGQEQSLGTTHPDTLVTGYNLALLLNATGRSAEAVPLLRSLLSRHAERFGPSNQQTLVVENTLALALLEAGQVKEGRAILERTAPLNEQMLGADNPTTLAADRALGNATAVSGDFVKAERMLQETLRRFERVFGEDHPETAVTQRDLALVLAYQGHYVQAERLTRDAQSTIESEFGSDSPLAMSVQQNLAIILQGQGKLVEAKTVIERVVTASNRVFGPDHLSSMAALLVYARVLNFMGELSESEALFRRILSVYEVRLGQDAPLTLFVASDLATVLEAQGRVGEAEQAYRRALDGLIKQFGASQSSTLITASSLARLFLSSGRTEEAGAVFRKVLEIHTQTLGPEHFLTVTSQISLASFLAATGQMKEAETLLRQALATVESTLDKNDVGRIGVWMNLGNLLFATQRFEEAELAYEEVVRGYTETLGSDHPMTLGARNSLANVYMLTGRKTEAIASHRSVIASIGNSLSETHPTFMASLSSLAVALASDGDFEEAAQLLERSVRASANWAERESGSAFSAELRRSAQNGSVWSDTFALSLAAFAPRPYTADLAALVTLNRKGIVEDREAALLRLARSDNDPAIVAIATNLLSARRALSHSFSAYPGDPSDPKAQQLFDLQNRQVDDLERSLMTAVPTYRTAVATTAQDVAANLPKASALIDFTVYRPYDFLNGFVPLNSYNVGALVMRDGRAVDFLDLGPLDDMQPLIDTLSETMGAGDRGSLAGLDLYRRLLAPLEHHLADIDTLFISPAGPLGYIPFDMLRKSDLSTMAESGPDIRLIATGRAFLSSVNGDGLGEGLAAFGDVAFDQVPEDANPPSTDLAAQIAVSDAGGSRLRSQEMQSFGPLPQTSVEIDAIASIWERRGIGSARIYRAAKASETRLKSLSPSPRVLHLATHGFVQKSADAGARAALLSGIALAGSNLSSARPNTDDGIVFGYEIEELDLSGTELVVISACETGLGKADGTEGIYNLARSFRVAGAKAVLVTLQPIDDALAAAFMEDFYDIWLAKPGTRPDVALRQTKQEWASDPDPRKSHPSAWASFILVENRV